MERISITERPDWREKATEYGFNFHTMYGEPYWSEEAYYKLTLENPSALAIFASRSRVGRRG